MTESSNHKEFRLRSSEQNKIQSLVILWVHKFFTSGVESGKKQPPLILLDRILTHKMSEASRPEYFSGLFTKRIGALTCADAENLQAEASYVMRACAFEILVHIIIFNGCLKLCRFACSPYRRRPFYFFCATSSSQRILRFPNISDCSRSFFAICREFCTSHTSETGCKPKRLLSALFLRTHFFNWPPGQHFESEKGNCNGLLSVNSVSGRRRT